jgi:hypothetical protein
MAAIFPYHTTDRAYTEEQTHVYHDRSDGSEGRKIKPVHQIDGRGGRLRCGECKRLEAAECPKSAS